MTRVHRVAALVVVLVAGALAARTRAYLKLGGETSSGVVSLKWVTPVNYLVTNRDIPGVTAVDLANAVGGAFAAWSGVSAVAIRPQFGGLTTLEPVTGDGATVIGFQEHDELESTLGLTTFFSDDSGHFLEADIFLNSAFPWSVAPGGEPGKFDVQSIATHEVGHLLGMGHSALGETQLLATGRRVIAKQAVMFPIAYPAGTTIDRTLKADDIAGITDIYATGSTAKMFGEISGKVTLNGVGLFGAHVIASNMTTGTLTGGFALDANGDFVIGGLVPGMYLLRAEPLDDADVGSFFSDSTVVNINFVPTFLSRLVAVPAGGTGAAVEIKVQPK